MPDLVCRFLQTCIRFHGNYSFVGMSPCKLESAAADLACMPHVEWEPGSDARRVKLPESRRSRSAKRGRMRGDALRAR